MDIDWDSNDEGDFMDGYYDESECQDDLDDYDKDDGMENVPILHCSLCDCTMPDSGALIAHVLSSSHNRRLQRESISSNSLLRKLLKKKRRGLVGRKSTWKSKETVLTKRLKYLSPRTKLEDTEDGEIVNEVAVDRNNDDDDDDDEEYDCDVFTKKVSLQKKKVGKDSIASGPAIATSKIDLRNKLNEMKEKQQEERKAEKRKKKNIRTREAKKRNKKMAREEKKRIEEALEALEEEDENIAFMKQTMGFSKFQSTKRSYF